MIADKYISKQLAEASLEDVFSSPAAMRQLTNVRTLVITSSSVLYTGAPVVAQYFAVQDQTFQTKQEVLSIAGSLGATVASPLFQALAAAAREASLVVREVDTDPLSGGVIGKLEKTWYVLGTEDVMESETIDLGASSRVLMQRLEQEGKEIFFLAQKQPKRLLGIFALEQVVRPKAPKTVRWLRELGVECVLVTSQKGRTAQALASHLGIEQVHSELDEVGKKKLLANFAKQATVPAFGVVSVGVVPTGGFAVGLDGAKGNVTVASLEKLPGVIIKAHTLLQKTQKLFFWCRM